MTRKTDHTGWAWDSSCASYNLWEPRKEPPLVRSKARPTVQMFSLCCVFPPYSGQAAELHRKWARLYNNTVFDQRHVKRLVRELVYLAVHHLVVKFTLLCNFHGHMLAEFSWMKAVFFCFFSILFFKKKESERRTDEFHIAKIFFLIQN